jgi:transcriptional regulator with XRE-family HTH domain
MSNTQTSHALDADSIRPTVAANLKALLKQHRWSERKAAVRLGLTQGYINRRTSGETELSTSDIVMFAPLFDLAPATLTDELLKLPHLDSNQEPIGSQSALVVSLVGRTAKTPRKLTPSEAPVRLLRVNP